MARAKNEEETALAAAEMWAARNDPDLLSGEIVELPGSSRSTPSVVVSVRLNSKELGEIEQAANAAGMGISTYMKHAAMTTACDPSRISRAEVLKQIEALGEGVAKAIAQVKDSVAAGTRAVAHTRSQNRLTSSD